MARYTKLWRNNCEALLSLTMLLCIIGFFNVFSASFVQAGQNGGDSYSFLKRHLFFMVVGGGAMLVCARLRYQRWRKLSPLAIVMAIGLLIAVFFGGVVSNGARRWLDFGAGISSQPSEPCKLACIMAAAGFIGPQMDDGTTVSILSWPFFLSLVASAFVLAQPDMGTAAVIIGLCVVVYLVAGISRRETTYLTLAAILASVGFVALAGYRSNRIAAWINPWAYQQTIGYQPVQALLAMGSGGLFGTGIGMGSSKFLYLPEAHTDFAFAVLSQEAGFLGAMIVLTLFFIFAKICVRITMDAHDGFGLLLSAGITAMIAGQAFANIAMVCGLLPVIGVPLPFISYGGTSLVVNLAAVGIMLNISKQSGQGEAEVPEEPVPPGKPQRLTLVNKLKSQKR